MKKITEKNKAQIIALREEGYGPSAIARKLGHPEWKDAIQKITRRSVGPVKNNVDPIKAMQSHIEQTRTYSAMLKAQKAVAGEMSFRESIGRMINEVVQPFKPQRTPSKPAPKKPGAIEETIVQMISDGHFGEIIDFEGTRGINRYDGKIAGQRLKRIVDSHLRVKRGLEKSGAWVLRKLIVVLGGDNVPGTIHEIERHTDGKNIVVVCAASAHLLAEALIDLSEAYEEMEVFCISGNHGRLPDHKKMPTKEPSRNWDTMIYLMVKAMLRDHKKIKFHVPNSYGVGFQIYKWNFCAYHGDSVPSWNSIPWYGLNRMMTNLNALEASRGNFVHYWLFGHYHSYSSLSLNGGESFINGSLCGANEYVVNRLGRAERPMQLMFGVHKDHGVTHRWPLLGETGDRDPGYQWRSLASL